MTWFFAFALAVIAFIVAIVALKMPRSGWEPLGAALLLGIAGYGLQASPGLGGAPKEPAQTIADDPAAMVNGRADLSEKGIPPSNRWVVIADGMARNGQYANAASVLLGAVEEDPDNGEAWLAMANALVAHADGQLTPASLYAFRNATDADPDNPGGPFFLGLALAQSGRFDEAKALWSELLERSAEDAPWREDLENRLKSLDEFIAGQPRGQMGR